MPRAIRMLPLALAFTLIAPVALAQQQMRSMGKQPSALGVLPGGMSFIGQLDHAYMEALNAHSAIAMGMPDMAGNHLANVDLVLANLERIDTRLDAATKNRLAAIRQDAATLKGNLSDRTAALTGTSNLVARFVTFYDQVASSMAGGGGGGANRPNKALPEIISEAADAAAQAQVALAGRDWETAQLHTRDVTRHLDMANRAVTMMGGRMASADRQRITALHAQAQALNSAVASRSGNSVRIAGNLVTQLGRDLSRFAEEEMGGGAGKMNR